MDQVITRDALELTAFEKEILRNAENILRRATLNCHINDNYIDAEQTRTNNQN